MQEKILELIDKYGQLSYQALKNFLGCDDLALQEALGPLEYEKIFKIGKEYVLIDNKELASGKAIFKNDKFFLETEEERIFILPKYYDNLTANDHVICRLTKDYYDRKEAHLVMIYKHDTKAFVAKCLNKHVKGKVLFRVLDKNHNFREIWVGDFDLGGATKNDLCLVEPIYVHNKLIGGKVVKVITSANALGADILSRVAASGVSYEFNEKIFEELSLIPDEVKENDLKNRRDFTNELVITIDGDDSKDFDDAVSLKELENGNYELQVHIADVSHYVKENSALDKEALVRGNSIYLVDRVIPMLPEKLSNGICSLNEDVIRLTLSCVMEVNSEGEIINSEVLQGYIKSKHRMTYNKVNAMLEKGDKTLIETYSDIYPILTQMALLSQKMRSRRENRGALDFDAPEMKIIVNSNGEPTDIQKRERGVGELLIEDFMLAANESVAEMLDHLNYPCCYRVHEEPSKEKLMKISPALKNLGFHLGNIGNGVKPTVFQKILKTIKGTEAEIAISQMLLRSMAKARYSKDSLGHYGLAATYYCHFTSPIRRYADLEVHRIIHNLILNPEDFNKKINHFEEVVPEICDQVSLMERKAIDLEREIDDMKAAEYMMGYIGEYFNGIITSVTSFGFFVMLDNGIEGLVHVKFLPDYYQYNEKDQTLIGDYSKEVFKLGDPVYIRVKDANKEDGKIDFMLIEHHYKGRKRK